MPNLILTQNTSSITCACTPIQRVGIGAMGGVIAGMVFGIMMNMLGMIGTIAMLVDSKSNVVGLVVHLSIPMVIRIAFSLLMEKRLKNLTAGLTYGMVYGIFW